MHTYFLHKLFFLISIFLFILLFRVQAAHAYTTYDITTGFDTANNPSADGRWAYGMKATNTNATFTPATIFNWNCSGITMYGWANAGLPWITKNTSGSSPYCYSFTAPAGKVLLHPSGSQYATLRFVAPTTTTYTISGRFAFTGVNNTDVHIVHNAGAAHTSIFDGVTNGGNTTTVFNLTRALAAGDTLDFTVGNGGDTPNSDATRLEGTVIDEDLTRLTGPFSLVDDFNASFNPVPDFAWRYGHKPTTTSGTFTLQHTLGQWGCGAATISSWSFGSSPPGMGKNTGPTAGTCSGNMTIPSGGIVMHPGSADQKETARWTAPVAGTYTIAGRFYNLGTQTTDVHVVHNTTSIFDGVVNTTTNTNTPFTLSQAVSAGDTIDFSVGYGTGGYGGDNTGAEATITLQSADLQVVSKTVDNANPQESDTVNYTITVQNNGPNNTTNVTFTDALPAGLTYVSSTPSVGSYVSGTGVWTIGSLANGASATLGIQAQVNTGTGGSTITNTVGSPSQDLADSNSGNNSGSVNVLVQDAPVCQTPLGSIGTDAYSATTQWPDGFCVYPAAATKQHVDGTGWIPINLSILPGGSPISSLPIDPTNTIADFVHPSSSDLVYRYACQNDVMGTGKNTGLFELNVVLESQAYTVDDPKMSRDGGDNDNYYELGNSLRLMGGGTSF